MRLWQRLAGAVCAGVAFASLMPHTAVTVGAPGGSPDPVPSESAALEGAALAAAREIIVLGYPEMEAADYLAHYAELTDTPAQP